MIKSSSKNNSSKEDNFSKEEYNEIPDYCFDNMKKIRIALGMYNSDHYKNMQNLDLKLLKREKYLRGELNTDDPECSYSIVGPDSKWLIKCSKHGILDLSEY